jgi:hypothetical protein
VVYVSGGRIRRSFRRVATISGSVYSKFRLEGGGNEVGRGGGRGKEGEERGEGGK